MNCWQNLADTIIWIGAKPFFIGKHLSVQFTCCVAVLWIWCVHNSMGHLVAATICPGQG